MNFEHLGVIESSLWMTWHSSKEANWTNYPKGVIWLSVRRA